MIIVVIIVSGILCGRIAVSVVIVVGIVLTVARLIPVYACPAVFLPLEILV